MELFTQSLSKQYAQRPVFSNLTLHIPVGSRTAITGSNGSGKSTLLKILSGGLLPSSGTIQYQLNGQGVSVEDVFRYVHFVAPYNTVVEELTVSELFDLHKQLGLLSSYASLNNWLQLLKYPFRIDQPVKSFSSGMKQRIKLGLALLDDRPLILLDEPGSNLDVGGKEWMVELIRALSAKQTLIIASNDPAEIALCDRKIAMGEKEPKVSGSGA